MKNTSIGIYVFHSKVSGFRYIGQSINLENRRKEHLRSLARGDHHSKHLQRSYSRNGPDSLEYSVLEHCEQEVLTEREQFWLDFYKPAGIYNSAPVADSNTGVTWTQESREKQSASQRGRTHSEETKKKIREAHLGRKFSQEHVENMRISRKGKPLTEETRAKLSAVRKGRKFSPEHIEKINAAKIGRRHSPESLEKMRLAKLGKIASPETRAKISAAGAGRIRSVESNKKMVETKARNKVLK